MEINDIEGAIEGILFASGDPVAVERIASVMGIEQKLVADVAGRMSDRYGFERRGVRIVRIEDSLQMCSSPEYADIIRLTLESGRQPRLSQTALEVLAVVAYFQPTTRAYIEQVRGVDSSYTVSLLQNRGLIEPVGRLDAPGRPITYGTTSGFLRTFGVASLGELPELPGVPDEGEQMSIINAISAYREAAGAEQDARAEETAAADGETG
ncbi:MAG: SMC-Scp complex subunit ScpB [Oscillospiraceae bacterium]|jgi:segregation and condensation protein B|nr:SMC-Scp complex subunit ScpB [Oscillospiraceae bacterium]